MADTDATPDSGRGLKLDTVELDSLLSDSKDHLVCCVFVHTWSPAATFVADHMLSLRDEGALSGCTTYVLDADAHADEAEAHDIAFAATPYLMFLWRGTPLTIRRTGAVDAKYMIGSLSKEHLVELVAHAVHCARSGEPVVQCDF